MIAYVSHVLALNRQLVNAFFLVEQGQVSEGGTTEIVTKGIDIKVQRALLQFLDNLEVVLYLRVAKVVFY